MSEKQGRESWTRVLDLFDEGRHFTEELLRENERLRAANAQSRNELRELQNQYVRIDVPHLQRKQALLEEELKSLRVENEELKAQFQSVEDENRDFADRYVEVERQNSDLVSLFVASQRLHSTLKYAEVVAIVKEIVVNLVGSEVFGVYVVDEAAGRLFLVGYEGLDDKSEPNVEIGADVLGVCVKTGEVFTAPEGSALHTAGHDPIACIPLKVGESVLGVIAIYALLRQKQSFRPVDFEMFELLGAHAASALYVSSMYAASERKRTTLEGLMTLIKSSP